MFSAFFGLIIGIAFMFGGVQIALETAVPTYQSWQGMQNWQATSALLIEVSSDPTDAKALYMYSVEGVEYENNRVSVATFKDNIGPYHQLMSERLQRAQKNYHTINIWYDPDKPHSSVIDRNMRWGLFSLMSGFCSIFIIIGLFICYASIKPTGKKTAAGNKPSLSELRRQWKQIQNESPQQESFLEFVRQQASQQQNQQAKSSGPSLKPWLKNKQWQNHPLRSEAKKSMWGMWLFAIFWNAVSSPILFVLEEELNKQNYPVLIALLFPLIGLFLIYKAWQITQEWRRFNVIELLLDPYPGSIGGHVGGTLLIKKNAEFNAQYKIELQCLHSYMSGSGDNRSQQETIKWSESGYAKKSITGSNLQLRFRFDVPDNLPEASVEQKGDYYCWRLKLSAELPGADLDRSYNIPVFKTEKHSRNIRHDLTAQAEKQRLIQSDDTRAAVSTGNFSSTALKRALRYKRKANKQIFYYPMFRNKALSLICFIFAAGFGFATYSINHNFAQGEIISIAMLIFSLPFAIVAFFASIATIYLPFNNLTVTLTNRKIKAIRRLFILPIQYKQINSQDIQNIDINSTGITGQGSKQIKHYKLNLKTKSFKQITIAEDIDGEELAQQLKEFICKQLYIDC